MIFFSVIIPTYNRGNLITETIDTVLSQSYPHFELIVVDDGSTDNTQEIIKKKYENDSRIRYFFKENEERGAARNFGLKQAKGDYAVFFDSDDRMLSHNLETLNGIIKDQPGISLLATKYNYINKGEIHHHPALKKLKEGWYDRDFFLKGNILACNYCIRISGAGYKFFPEERELASMEDWLFLMQNLEKDKIFIKDEIGVTMRQHDNRSMMDNQKVIAARKKANEWIVRNIELSVKDKKILNAWSHYFCGIHQYLDHNRKLAIKEATAALSLGGLNRKFFTLLLKAMIGRRFIQKLK